MYLFESQSRRPFPPSRRFGQSRGLAKPRQTTAGDQTASQARPANNGGSDAAAQRSVPDGTPERDQALAASPFIAAPAKRVWAKRATHAETRIPPADDTAAAHVVVAPYANTPAAPSRFSGPRRAPLLRDLGAAEALGKYNPRAEDSSRVSRNRFPLAVYIENGIDQNSIALFFAFRCAMEGEQNNIIGYGIRTKGIYMRAGGSSLSPVVYTKNKCSATMSSYALS